MVLGGESRAIPLPCLFVFKIVFAVSATLTAFLISSVAHAADLNSIASVANGGKSIETAFLLSGIYVAVSGIIIALVARKKN
jgi:hypothetical protein